MAAITGAQISRLYIEGPAAQLCLYALRDVTSGDTIDLGPSGTGDFMVVKQATMIGSTVNGSATATASGTVITMPAGLSSDSIYLTAWGDA